MGVLQRLKAIIRPTKSSTGPDYEKILADNFQRFLKPGDWVADVGAHTGVHTVKMVESVGMTGRVIAFEPLPKCYQSLLKRFRNHPNVEILNVALSNFCESNTAFTEAAGTPAESGLKRREFNFPERAKPREIRVEVTTLDRAVGGWERLDYLKIDIEGGELDCLEGGAAVLARHRPIISFECGYDAFAHYGKAIGDFLSYAVATDCRIFDLFGYEIRTEEEMQSAMGTMWDFYFVPTSKVRGFLAALKA
jgi:FkbM family methyltransferase